MFPHHSIIAFLLASSIHILPCSGYVNWIYPSNTTTGLVFNYIDTVYFTWTSSITDPYMNLWCTPSDSTQQSSTPLYHAEISTNGTNPQSFPYSDYYNGQCHMQVEDFAGDDVGNTPAPGGFKITSDDGIAAQTYGLEAINLLGGASSATATLSTSSTRTSATTTPSSSSSSPSPVSSASTTPSTAIPISTPTPTPTKPTPPHSAPLSTAAKAGISIGSAFSALTLILAAVLFYIARFRQTGDPKKQDTDPFERDEPDGPQISSEVGLGPYYEVHGRARPNELQGQDRVELDWMPRVELGAVERVEMGEEVPVFVGDGEGDRHEI
ncbi:hypothetical protein P7C71_g3092, partial [Lecanoromycetidae sp. Uapishka_2]